MILAGKGYIPVISPIATDEKGNDLNVNADTVAGDIASAINAKKLISLTDVPEYFEIQKILKLASQELPLMKLKLSLQKIS